jgi:hypothetical protein
MMTLLEQNRKHQQTHRNKLKSQLGIDEYKRQRAEFMKLYRAQRKEKEFKDLKPTIKPIELPSINITSTKKQPKGLKYSIEKLDNTVPSYITRDKPLEPNTIDNYNSKSNTINKLMLNKPLSTTMKNELNKLFHDKPFNEKLILDEMNYLNDIETVIKSLRRKYSNDNTLKSYLIVLTAIISHFPILRGSYLKITKLSKQINQITEDKRDENITTNPEKIIDLSDKKALLDNIDKLGNINDKLIYAINVLIPPRRLENRFIRITDETDTDKLKTTDNYLIVNGNGKWKFIYNEYKTAKNLGQHPVNVPDDLKKILHEYIAINNLNIGDYLFSLKRDKRELISQPNFSSKISNVFNKIHGLKISNRFLRYSKATDTAHLSKKEHKQLASDMGHSLNQSLSYRKHKT